jgi:hypothetical protein
MSSVLALKIVSEYHCRAAVARQRRQQFYDSSAFFVILVQGLMAIA